MVISKKKSILSNHQDMFRKARKYKVYRLKKALYGLKQAPRAWNTRVDEYFQKNGFMKESIRACTLHKNKFRGEIL